MWIQACLNLGHSEKLLDSARNRYSCPSQPRSSGCRVTGFGLSAQRSLAHLGGREPSQAVSILFQSTELDPQLSIPHAFAQPFTPTEAVAEVTGTESQAGMGHNTAEADARALLALLPTSSALCNHGQTKLL